MEKVLIQQVVQAVDERCIATLPNMIAGHVLSDCQDILLYLFGVYSKVTPQQLVTEEDDIKTLKYNTGTMINVIFYTVEDQ